MRAVLSAATVLVLAPLPAVAQQVVVRDSAPICTCSGTHNPNVMFFGKPRGDGPAIGVETSSGSVRDTLGVLIIGVTTNGPADKAGIEEGDRIATANGVDLRLTAADAGDREMHGLMARRLARAVQKLKAGDPVELRVYHDGQYRTAKVTTVKASDLAVDDDGFNYGFRTFGPGDMPEIGRSLDDMHLELPDVRALGRLDDIGRQIRIQLRPHPMPVEIYEDGIHRM